MPQLTREHIDTHVSPKLRRNIRMYLGISAVMLVVIAYRILSAGNGLLYAVLAFAIGLIIGVAVSRMYAISWDQDTELVVSRMDMYGAIFLIVYILFEIASRYFIEHWFEGPLVVTVILASVGGALVGRGLGMAKKMANVLRRNV